eukprot:c18611_g1_i1 orf=226-840(+)
MGTTDSKSSTPEQETVDGITTVIGRTEETDPYVERLNKLVIATPILKSLPVESSLKDLLLRRSLSQRHAGEHGALDPTTTTQLLTLYQEWQRVTSQKIMENQEHLVNKIDAVEALAIKLLQQLNYSLSVMKTSAMHLENVNLLKVEVGEMKGKLMEVLENYDSLCKRVGAEEPDFVNLTVRSFSTNDMLTGRENFHMQMSSKSM